MSWTYKTAYYDFDTKPITQGQWADLFMVNRHMGNHRITHNGRRYQVSTVWLGMDMGFTGGTPIGIFETMVFDHTGGNNYGSEVLQWRYTYREQAMKGHREALKAMRREKWDHRPVIHKGGKP